MPEIACGCCGATHASVTEIRVCCARAEAEGRVPVAVTRGDPPADTDIEPPWNDSSAPRLFSPTPPPAPTPGEPCHPTTADELTTIEPVLGRVAVVDAGSPRPAAWAAIETVIVDDAVLADPRAVVDTLQQAWVERRSAVVELHAAFAERPAEVTRLAVHELDPAFEFPLERLHHLVWGHRTDEQLLVGHAPPGAPPSTADLAPDQLAAVHHEGGAARIIAPAGSGKTRVLTERARLLVSGWHVPAVQVGLVAFNTRAAGEMRERLADVRGLVPRTLNSLGLAIVAGTGTYATPGSSQRRVGVLDEAGVRDLLTRLVDLPRKTNTDPAAAWLEALTQVRLGLRSPSEVESDYQGDIEGFTGFFDRYREALAERGVVDFDEQIYRAVELLVTEPAVRVTAQRACRTLLVDEFQDLTPAHLLLIRLLAAPAYDVFGVGDDDQTIYGYTGADPDWLLRFDTWFPGAASHPLHVNYRCPPAVVGAADCLLSHNRRRVDKQITARPGRTGGPADLRVEVVDDPEVTCVAEVRALVDAGVAPDDIAVLTRVNAALAAVQIGLSEAGVPCTTPVDSRFLDRTGVRAALGWLSVAKGSWHGAGVIRETARRPSRGIAPKVVDWMSEQSDLAGIERLAARLQDRDAAKVSDWLTAARGMTRAFGRGASTAELIERIRTDVGLGRATDTLDLSRRVVDRSSHHDDLDALEALAGLHPDPATFAGWLAGHLRGEGGRVGAGRGEDVAGRVLLSTIHRVKGQEWPHVVVHNVGEGLLPHRLAVGTAGLEEERRLLHVAVTRCSEQVVVIAPEARPSPFVAELTERWDATTAPAPRARRASAGPTPVEATVGLEFDEGGYALTVIELNESGVVATTAGGRARVQVKFGTTIRVDGDDRSLVAPGSVGGRKGRAVSKGGAPRDFSPADEALREALRDWRRKRSSADAVPAYVVFSDATLDDIVSRRPATSDDLLRCKGIGPAKLERFGDELLAAIDAAG